MCVYVLMSVQFWWGTCGGSNKTTVAWITVIAQHSARKNLYRQKQPSVLCRND